MHNDDLKMDALSKFRDLNFDPAIIDSKGFNLMKTNTSSIGNYNSSISSFLPNTNFTANSFILKNNSSIFIFIFQ